MPSSAGEPYEIEYRFVVWDNGAGIEEEKQERIFDPFAQADRRLSRSQDGVGRGLAISRDLVAAWAGTSRWNASGPRSTFTLVLSPATSELNG